MKNKYFTYGIGSKDSDGYVLPSSQVFYGPYASVADAHTAVSAAFESNIPIGLTVGIKNGNTIKEYWYNGGTAKSNLVVKDTVGTGMSDADKTKLNGIEAGANRYVHPTVEAVTPGLYKITTNDTGHVTAATAVSREDIINLGIPGSATTYSVATTSTDGLMSKYDKAILETLVASEGLKLAKVTQEYYDEMKAAGTADINTLYVITNG